jgi:hypothetical protein
MKLPPIISTCLLALSIDCCSNIIAQKLRAWKAGIPFVFDYTLFFQFAILVVLTVPVNFHWQNWLERTFPGWKVVKQKRDKSSLNDEEKAISLKEEKKMDDEEEVKVRNWGKHIPEMVHGLHYDGRAVKYDDVFSADGDHEGEDHSSYFDRFEKCKIIDSKLQL